jgi:carboxypeptidase Q
MLGLGGSIGTPPEGITADVLVVRTFAELSNRVSEAKGKIVLFDAPFTRYGETVRFRVTGASEAAKAGAVASLIRSVGDFSLRTPHTGMMIYQEGVAKIPHAALAPEDADRLARLADAGTRIVVRLKMAARTEAPVESQNIIAEIRGSEAPDEVVVLGGHFDSWDVGRGAQDDGGGCMASWEALRLIKQLGLKPRRTIRCVLWNNEEFGLAGAKAYRDTHASELDKHVLALESDEGTFTPRGFGFVGSEAGMQLIQQIGTLLQETLSAGTIVKGGAQADVGPLLERGVPVMGLNTDLTRYFWYHHTASDTPDKVDPIDLAKCSGAMALVVYALAESELRLPR